MPGAQSKFGRDSDEESSGGPRERWQDKVILVPAVRKNGKVYAFNGYRYHLNKKIGHQTYFVCVQKHAKGNTNLR